MEKFAEEVNWFHSVGREFQTAFVLLVDHPAAPIVRPSFYCAAFSVEQFLKAFLAVESISFERQQGHNLDYLLDLNKEKTVAFFGLTEYDIRRISILNKSYYEDEFFGRDDLRYGRKPGKRDFPHEDDLKELLNIMEEKLRVYLYQAI